LLYIKEVLLHNVPMKKKKPNKTLSKKTIIQPPAMEPERQSLCSAQNSCSISGTSCPCPTLIAMLEEEARLFEEKVRLLKEKARLEAESAELQRMLLARQQKDRR